MAKRARFSVSPKLTMLLGDSYRTSEHALKELIDNAWDADATVVEVVLPEALDDDAIVTITDDGSGMTPSEVDRHYLSIAAGRSSRIGDVTVTGRRVKGRKGVGKFSGLVVADCMEVRSRCRGKESVLVIKKGDILASPMDLERIDLPLTEAACDPNEHGTEVRLSNLHHNLQYPSGEALKLLLIRDYAREENFQIRINGKVLGFDAIPGRHNEVEISLSSGKTVKMSFKIADNPLRSKDAGINLRVGGRLVGEPNFLGLDDDEEVPRKLLRSVVGEMDADSIEGIFTGALDGIVENNKEWEELQQKAQVVVKDALRLEFQNQMTLAKARMTQAVRRRLAEMPENRRLFCEQAIESAFTKFYGENPEKYDALASVVLDAMEHNEYWFVLRAINDAKDQDVHKLADALVAFSLLDLASIGAQAKRRIALLDSLSIVANDDTALESEVHRILEQSSWVFGAKYSLMFSNESLSHAVERMLAGGMKPRKDMRRPDLFFATDVAQRHLLVELKRPSERIDHSHCSQASAYRDYLESNDQFQGIDVLVIGGSVAPGIRPENLPRNLVPMSYNNLLAQARNEINWLLRQLGAGADTGC